MATALWIFLAAACTVSIASICIDIRMIMHMKSILDRKID